MKKLFAVILLLPTLVFTQGNNYHVYSEKHLGVMPVKEGKVHYTEVVEMKGCSQSELYCRAKIYFDNAYASAKNVFQYQEAGSGLIAGKSYLMEDWTFALVTNHVDINHSISIFCEDNKYTIEMKDFECRYSTNFNTTMTSEVATVFPIEDMGSKAGNKGAKFLERVDRKVTAQINDIKREMNVECMTNN